MRISKEDLKERIKETRERMDESYDLKKDYEDTLNISRELDKLIEQYIVAGY